MKNLFFTILAFLLFTKISTAQTNANPVVTITAPTRTVVVYSNQTYTVTANATDADGIAKVEFYAGTQLIGADTEAPYSAVFSTTNFPQPIWGWNDWTITVKAYDRTGAMTSVSTNSSTWLSMRTYFDAGIKSAGVTGTDGRAITCWFTLNKNGATNITSARIGYQLDNQPERFLDWTGNIIDGNFSQTINLPTLANTNGLHTIKYRIVSRNGQESDEVAANDVMSYTFLSNIINKLPTVALVAPVANIYVPTTILSNQTFTFKATAKDPDGTIKKVDFYFDNTLIASDDTEPFEFTKSSFDVGTFIVVAKATDDSDGVTTSTAAKLIVKPNLDIALTNISQPSTAPTTTTITPMVTLKNTGSDIITSAAIAYSVDGGNPISFNWAGSLAANSTVNVTLPVYRNENGAHTFVATVSNPNGGVDGDNSNNKMTRSYTSAVVNSLPTAKMLTPSYLSTIYSGTEFNFSASATDRDGWITKVEFYLGSTLIGTDTQEPFELKRSDIAVGTHAVTAKAYDDRAGVFVSTPTTLKVIPALNIALTNISQPSTAPTTTTIAPVVSIKNLGNITITTATITYTVDGGAAKSFDWTGSLAANATLNVTLPVFRNENGNHTFVAKVSNPNGGVDGNEADNTMTRTFTSAVVNSLPTVKMVTPSYLSTIYSGTEFTFSASATDRDGWITKVEFYLGGILLGSDTEAPFELKRNDIAVGTYAITAKAYDDREGGVAVSAATTLKVIPALNIAISSIFQPVAAPTTPVIAPIVGLKNLGNIVITSATITYAVDGGEVKSLNWTGSLAANATVNVTLPTFRNENGTHTFVTTVSNPNGGVDGDNNDNSKTLTFVSKVINTLPSVNMLTPSYRSTIKSKDAFTLSANATDRDGWITKVEFYLGTTLVGTATQAPYALTLREWQVGTFEVTARAYDDRNGVKISNITTLIVTQAATNAIVKNNDNIQELTEKTILNTENSGQVIVENRAKAKYKIKEENNLSLAPNPASNYTNMSINLAKEGEYKLMITNMSGKTVQSNTVQFNKGENRLELDVTTLPAGLYFVSLNNNESSMLKKLIVTK